MLTHNEKTQLLIAVLVVIYLIAYIIMVPYSNLLNNSTLALVLLSTITALLMYFCIKYKVMLYVYVKITKIFIKYK